MAQTPKMFQRASILKLRGLGFRVRGLGSGIYQVYV